MEVALDQSVEEMQTVLLILVRTIVDDHGAIQISKQTHNSEVIFTVRVAKSDLGKLIGKGGRTARSLRILLTAASMKHSRRFGLDIDGE